MYIAYTSSSVFLILLFFILHFGSVWQSTLANCRLTFEFISFFVSRRAVFCHLRIRGTCSDRSSNCGGSKSAVHYPHTPST